MVGFADGRDNRGILQGEALARAVRCYRPGLLIVVADFLQDFAGAAGKAQGFTSVAQAATLKLTVRNNVGAVTKRKGNFIGDNDSEFTRADIHTTFT